MRARAALLVVPLLLAGCGGGDEQDAASSSSPSASAAPVWNPCDGLDVAGIEGALGARLTQEAGSADAPRCTLLPAVEGGAVVDANYLVFPAGLDAAWKQMGAPDDGSVTEPEIPGADAARMVADAGTEVLAVTGFVQDGELVQVVNAADPAPYDERAVTAAVRETMQQLSAHAQAGGGPS
ncbi:hypothetical protein [Nocardioides sp. W7]|uniref:hypothetical protein n=1 Tax=Nocardioides sp. W7 TaxID=2931390 RepID=UPI001FD33D2B|nr:hypothetical protein [Nocardioides sp. W7]